MMSQRYRRLTVLGCLLLVSGPATLPAAEAERCPKPVNTCVLEQRAAHQKHGVVGIQYSQAARQELPPGTFLLKSVPSGYPAHSAGLKPGDILLTLKKKPVTGLSLAAVERLMDTIEVGEVVPLEVLREGKKLTLAVTAGKPDPMSIEAWTSQHVRRAHSEEDFRRYLRELRTVPAQKTE